VDLSHLATEGDQADKRIQEELNNAA